MGDVSPDDIFANLSIFVQRLVLEDERELLAWNPMQDEQIYKLSAVIQGTENDLQQNILITPLTSGTKT